MITEDDFPLTVNVPVKEYAYVTRRARYLEAVALQVLGDRRRLREWFSAADLAALRLPGLPTTPQALGRLARSERWSWRDAAGQGRNVREYHCTALPARAFEALIDRIRPVAATEGRAARAASAQLTPPVSAPKPKIKEAAPPWLLPLLRVIRRQEKLSVAGAVAALPACLPPGVACPTYEEAEAALRSIGMVAGE